MVLPNLNPPFPDLPNGYTVTDAEWNGQFDSIFNYLNGTVKGAIDALQSAPPPSVGAQAFFNGRLTLESGVPISNVDQTNKTNILLTPFMGNLIGLYDTTSLAWSNFTFPELTIAVPAVVRQLADVFVRQSGGVCSLELGLYKTLTATNNPAAGHPVTINVSSTTDVVVGDVISIVSAGGSEEAVVTAISAGVSITVDWLEFSHTTPTIGLAVPVNALALQDAIPVKGTDFSRRYVGTFTTLASGQTSDMLSARCVANYYNRIQRPFGAYPAAATWLTSSLSLFPLGATKNLGDYRNLFVNPAYGVIPISGTHGRAANNEAGLGIGLNTNAFGQYSAGGSTAINNQTDEDDQSFSHGFSFISNLRGRQILHAMGSNPLGNKTYINFVSFGGGNHQLGYITGTVLN